MLRKRNFKTKSEYLLIAVQNKAIRINHIKARIDKKQQNSKRSLCDDRDKTINYIIGECCKLTQKEYKTRNDWVGKMIHWEFCKNFKYENTKKWSMQNPESVLENETHKLLGDFAVQTVHQISARRPDLLIINKKKDNLENYGHCCLGWPQSKIERKQKESTSTLLENWKCCKTCKWRLYQLQMVLLVQSLKKS